MSTFDFWLIAISFFLFALAVPVAVLLGVKFADWLIDGPLARAGSMGRCGPQRSEDTAH